MNIFQVYLMVMIESQLIKVDDNKVERDAVFQHDVDVAHGYGITRRAVFEAHILRRDASRNEADEQTRSELRTERRVAPQVLLPSGSSGKRAACDRF